MDKTQLKEQVETIRQAFAYINRFKGETFVIKLDSSLYGHPLFPTVIKDLVLLHQMGIRIAIVPGAKTRIDEVLARYGVTCKTVEGIRISPPETIPLIKMAAFDVCNNVMTLLAENSTNAIIGNWVKARSIGVRNGIDFQNSGLVDKLQTGIITSMLAEGLIPIFPNIGWNAKGVPYNISSNELALTVARELGAAKIFFITDFGGIPSKGYTIPKGVYVSSDGIISQMTVNEAGQFIDINASSKLKQPFELVSLAYRACKQGTRRVHIIDGRTEGMVLKEVFSNRGLGTMVYANQLDNIRPAAYADIPEILNLMEPLADDDILVRRSSQDIADRLDDYVVYEVDGTLHACGALHVFANKTAEIAGIAVDATYVSLGTGKKVVTSLMEKAVKLKLRKVFLLTTQTADWFFQLGFVKGTVADLPPERQKTYNRKRKSHVLAYQVSRHRREQTLMVE